MAARANAENFEELVLKSELPVLVDFYSDIMHPMQDDGRGCRRH